MHSFRDLRRGLFLMYLLLGSCLPAPSLAPNRDAGQDTSPATVAPAVRDVTIVDADGSSYERDAIPLRPYFALRFTAPLEGDPEPIVLLRGELDGDLLGDLDARPLRAATRARQVATRIERTGLAALAQPVAALDPGASYVLAVGGWAGEDPTLGLAFAVALKVAVSGGGARLAGTWPADGTEGVPGNLPFVAVRFDESVRGMPGGLRLIDGTGGIVPTHARLVSCVEVGWEEGDCALLAPNDPLWAGRDHRIEITEDVLDRGGSPVGPSTVHFRTAVGPVEAPHLQAPPCALDEELWPAPDGADVPPEPSAARACVLADDRALHLRLAATGPLRFVLTGGRDTVTAVAPRGDATLDLVGLSPDTAYDLELRTVDLAGEESRLSLALRTTLRLDQVYVSEVRADPAGAEPSQEYVELWNAGSSAADLDGYALSDSPTREGDVFAGAGSLGPGERLLVVPEGFDPSDTRDVAPPPGARLLHIGTSLGSGGLSNSGEPLFLRDALGRRLSGAPASSSAGPGVCLVRIAEDGRRVDAAAFAFIEPCTPGSDSRAR